MIPHDDKPQETLMLRITVRAKSILTEVALGVVLDLLPDSFFEGNSLLGPAAVNGVHRVRGLLRKQWRRDDFFPSDALRQFSHLVQVVQLLRFHLRKFRFPLRSIQFHQAPERVVG